MSDNFFSKYPVADPTSGTVTSVAMTVPAFLSISGSPITSSGTLALSLSGTALPIANGGTGQTSASNAINALLPTQTGHSGEFLTTNGTVASWAAASGGADTTLSNLTSPVAFNQHLLPNADVTFTLGASAFQLTEVWSTAFFSTAGGQDMLFQHLSLGGVVALQTNSGDIRLSAEAGEVDINSTKVNVNSEFMDFLGGNKIINLADPTTAQGAATKKYVDDSAGVQTESLGETNIVSDDTGIDTNTANYQLRTDSFGIWMHYSGNITWDGNGSGATTFMVTLPGGFLLDQSRIPGDIEPILDAAAAVVGFCRWYSQGIGWFTGAVEAVTEATVKFTVSQTLLQSTFLMGDGLGFIIDIPVVSP